LRFCAFSALVALVSFVYFLPVVHRALLSFPYTTLFRSLASLEMDGIRHTGALGIGTCQAQRLLVRIEALDGCLGIRTHLRARVGDRKSTRLNSSHVKISYAVFCLKKKQTTKPS